jgi:L-aminopeptidase/D-esterase-like protein
MRRITISEIGGFSVGHWEDPVNRTGCTVILAPNGAVASSHHPGFAPASHETEVLRPQNSVEALHGLVLTGGSAFGLSAASGVVRHLLEQGAGLDTGHIKVPIVAGAAIYDYPRNRSQGRLPDERSGYEAARTASKEPVLSGPYGAGVSAASGQINGPELASPSGLGSYGVVADGVEMAALAVVNPLGSVVDYSTGRVVSGLKRPDGQLADQGEILESLRQRGQDGAIFQRQNTVLVAVATNAKLSKLDARRLAVMAAGGINRAVYPANTIWDGDTIFALASNGGPEVELGWLGALATEVVGRAIVVSANDITGSE